MGSQGGRGVSEMNPEGLVAESGFADPLRLFPSRALRSISFNSNSAGMFGGWD